METYAFVRSRTFYREYDYRLLTPITKIPETTHQYFEKCVRNILSDSSQNEEPWDEPTWLFIKQDKYILWGVACNNKIFSEECYYEEYAKRPVRCFCGVVYVDVAIDSLKLPYTTTAFQPVFDDTVGKYWKERTSEKADITISLGEANIYIEPSKWKKELNDNPRICRLHPASSNVKELLSACMTSSMDISIAVNVMARDQVYDKKSFTALLNAVMRQGKSTIDIPIMQKCKNCEGGEDELKDGLSKDCQNKENILSGDINTREEHKEIVLWTCKKCGQQKEWVNDKGLCVDCEEKEYRKKIIRYIFIGLSVLFLFYVKMSSSGNNQLEESSSKDCIPFDSLSHTYDTINLSTQK